MLREDQVQRYGRQILLREVGGVGQERLLARPVEVRGSGPAFSVAAAYLAAGGTPVRLAPGVALDGFLAGTPLEAFNPDAVSAAATWATLSAVTSPRAVARVELVIGGAGLAWRSESSCPDCFAATVAQLAPGEASPELAGTLAALALQRLALGLGPDSQLLWFGSRLHAERLTGCAAHP